MRLGEKIRYLRHLEGTLRGLGREMTQLEIVRAIDRELDQSLSQSYLSQIEKGTRPHLTSTTRALLARFFKVHPGYLVDDPEGFHTELTSHHLPAEDSLRLWLAEGAERFRRDREVSRALHRLAQAKDPRRYLVLLGEILETPNLAERLLEVLRPQQSGAIPQPRPATRGRKRTKKGGSP
jgi:transcriptional regulator with XRE-family HTH domain